MYERNKLLKIFKKEVKLLEFFNCLGCESQKPHTHSYYEGEFNLQALENLYKNREINNEEKEWLKKWLTKGKNDNIEM